MAFASQQITLVGSTATPLLVQGTTGTKFPNVPTASVQDPISVWLLNPSTTTTYIGGPGVTNSNGFALVQNVALNVTVYSDSEVPYAYSTGTPTISVLVNRQ